MAYIEGESFLVNHTFRFIYPILRMYGIDFIKRISMLYKQGIFIDDIMNIRMNDKDYLHIVVNIPKTLEIYDGKSIEDTIEWLKSKDIMEKDYIFSINRNNKKPSRIILMLKIPYKYQGCIDNFLKGDMKMFEIEDIRKYFVSPDKDNEPFFTYCRYVLEKGKKMEIELQNEVLNL